MINEAHFHLSGIVNKQTFRYWSATNPIELHERPLQSSKVTVRGAIFAFGIIVPYFFEDEGKVRKCDGTKLRSHAGEILRS